MVQDYLLLQGYVLVQHRVLPVGGNHAAAAYKQVFEIDDGRRLGGAEIVGAEGCQTVVAAEIYAAVTCDAAAFLMILIARRLPVVVIVREDRTPAFHPYAHQTVGAARPDVAVAVLLET